MDNLIGRGDGRVWGLILVAGVLVYAGLLLGRCAGRGPSFRRRSQVRPPEQFALGLGTWMVGRLLWAIQATLDLLYQASADVGEWFFRRTSPSLQDRFRFRP